MWPWDHSCPRFQRLKLARSPGDRQTFLLRQLKDRHRWLAVAPGSRVGPAWGMGLRCADCHRYPVTEGGELPVTGRAQGKLCLESKASGQLTAGDGAEGSWVRGGWDQLLRGSSSVATVRLACGRTSVCAGEGFLPPQPWAFEGLGSGRGRGSEVRVDVCLALDGFHPSPGGKRGEDFLI